MRFLYPAELHHYSPDEVVVSFRDIHWCHTSGQDESEALEEAQDALEEAIAAYVKDGGPIPVPSEPLPGEHLVPLPANMAAKAALVMAIRASGLTCAQVAERVRTKEESIQRLLDPKNETPPHEISKVLRVLGNELVVEVSELPIPARTQA